MPMGGVLIKLFVIISLKSILAKYSVLQKQHSNRVQNYELLRIYTNSPYTFSNKLYAEYM